MTETSRWMTRARLAIAFVVVAGALSNPSAARAYTNVATSCVTPASPYACLRVNRTAAGTLYFVVITWDNPRPSQHHLRGVVQVCVIKLRRICQSRMLHTDASGIWFTPPIGWAHNYPSEGPGRYAVNWYWRGRKMGRTLVFRQVGRAALAPRTAGGRGSSYRMVRGLSPTTPRTRTGGGVDGAL